MNFSHTLKRPLVALALCSFSLSATAQTALPAPEVVAPLAPVFQNALDRGRALERNEKLWHTELEWKEKDASLSSVVARVQTDLGESAPPLEVRSPTPTKSTFALSKAPLGPTLVCLAQLSNCRVWVFFNRIVVAPETALTDEERAAIKRGEGGDWTLSSVGGGTWNRSWSGRDFQDRTLSRLVGEDIKTRLAAKGVAAPVQDELPTMIAGGRIIRSMNSEKAPFELPFGELQPASQRALQEMVNGKAKRFSGSSKTELSPEVVVCFDDTQSNRMRLFLRGTSFNPFLARWDFAEK